MNSVKQHNVLKTIFMVAIRQAFSPEQNNRTFVSETYWLAPGMQLTDRGLGAMFNDFSYYKYTKGNYNGCGVLWQRAMVL